MNNDFNKIIESVKSVKLSENEKAIMRANVISGVISSPYHDVTNSTPSRLYYRSGILNNLNLLIKQNNYMTALIIAIMLAMTGGTSVVAENSVPGDALYTVKTSFNEPIAGLFAVSKESEAVWQERLVERRIEEAQKVLSEGTVSTTTKAEIQTNVSNQVDRFTLVVKDLSNNEEHAISSSELIARLESALKANQQIIERAERDGKIATSTKSTAKELLVVLKDKEDEVKDNRQKIELTLGDTVNASSTATSTNASSTATSTNATTTQISALNKQAVAEKIFGDVKAKYESEKIKLSTTTKTKIDEKIAQAEKILADGKTAMSEGKFDTAREKFQEVIKLANDARVDILTGSIKSNIEDDMDMEHEDDEDEDRDKKDKSKGGHDEDEDDDEDDEDDEDDDNKSSVKRNTESLKRF